MKQLNLGNSAKKGEALEELQREVRIMSALSHPNIVNLRVRHSDLTHTRDASSIAVC